MGKRAKLATRCMRCRMHAAMCVCDLVPRIALSTRVVVVMHHREWTKTTATAFLARLALPGCELRQRGLPDEPLDARGLDDPARRALVLFPEDDAPVLTPELVAADPRPITLVVPDGSWRQATKIPRREPALRDLPRVRLTDDAPTRYRLRSEPRAGGLATFEAIARALGVIEGEAVRAQLEAAFDAMVERTLATRGV